MLLDSGSEDLFCFEHLRWPYVLLWLYLAIALKNRQISFQHKWVGQFFDKKNEFDELTSVEKL
jgi:hypothetical protein